MTVTDVATLLLSIFFLVRGASRGFLNSLTGPFSIIAASAISIIYYQTTRDIIASLLIGLISPWILNLLLKFLIKILVKATTDTKQPRLSSRLGGALLTFAWGWVFIILTLILLTVLPPWGETLTTIHDDVSSSASYIYIAKPLEEHFFATSKQNATAVTSETSSSDVKSLIEDPRFQKVLKDPDIQKEIDARDIAKLMNNPKIIDLVQQIMNDPAAMKKVFALYSPQIQPVLKPDTPNSSQATKNP